MKKILAAVIISIAALISVPFASVGAAPYCGITWGSGTKSGGIVMTRVPITNVRTGQHSCYDRLAIDLAGANRAQYSVKYVSQVYADPSGKLIPLKGGTKLLIVVKAPLSSSYKATVGKDLPHVNLAGYRTFRDAKLAGNFEGVTSIGLGVRTKLPFRVFKSGNSIVIDVAHKWQN